MASLLMSVFRAAVISSAIVIPKRSGAADFVIKQQASTSIEVSTIDVGATIQTNGTPDGVAWNSSGSRIAAQVSNGARKVLAWMPDGTKSDEFDLLTTWPPSVYLAFVTDSLLAMPPTTEASHVAMSIFELGSDHIIQEVLGRDGDAPGRAGWLHSVAVSPDKSRLAATFSYGLVLYSTSSWKPVAFLASDQADLQFSSVVYSHDGKMLAFAQGTAITVVNSSNLAIVRRIEAFRTAAKECCVSSISFSPDGLQIAAAGNATFNGSCRRKWTFQDYNCENNELLTPIRIFTIANGTQDQQFRGPVWPARNLIWSRRGYLIFLTNGGFYLWDPSTDKRQFVPIGTNAVSMALSTDQANLAICLDRHIGFYILR